MKSLQRKDAEIEKLRNLCEKYKSRIIELEAELRKIQKK